MKLYSVNIGSLIVRFHLFTALVVLLGFAGYLYLGIIIGMVLFLSSIVGLQFKNRAHERQEADTLNIPALLKHVHIPAHRYKIWHQQHHWHGHGYGHHV